MSSYGHTHVSKYATAIVNLSKFDVIRGMNEFRKVKPFSFFLVSEWEQQYSVQPSPWNTPPSAIIPPLTPLPLRSTTKRVLWHHTAMSFLLTRRLARFPRVLGIHPEISLLFRKILQAVTIFPKVAGMAPIGRSGVGGSVRLQKKKEEKKKFDNSQPVLSHPSSSSSSSSRNPVIKPC